LAAHDFNQWDNVGWVERVPDENTLGVLRQATE
jgi:hypothetical protein